MSIDHLSPEAKAEQIRMALSELSLSLPQEKLNEAGVDMASLSELFKDYGDAGMPSDDLRDQLGRYMDAMQQETDKSEDWEEREVLSVKMSVSMARLQFENRAVFTAQDSIFDALNKADQLLNIVSENRRLEIEALIAKLEELSKLMD